MGSLVYTCSNKNACDLAKKAGDLWGDLIGEEKDPLGGSLGFSCCQGDGCNEPGAAALAQQPRPSPSSQ
eukprot:6161152-Pyramimonas_sp.AAC.1